MMRSRQLQFTNSRAFSHERTDGRDEWLTPRSLLTALGEFDLDPCSPINRPWDTAKTHYTIEDDGLSKNWSGRVWLNPPYGSALPVWMERMAQHEKGIALIFARTETAAFFDHVWPMIATGILFIRGRIRFCDITGTEQDSAGAPSVLISYGIKDAFALAGSGIEGHYVALNQRNT